MKALGEVVLATLDRGEDLGYRGWSKFDGLESPVTRALSFGAWPLRLAWTQAVMRSPVNLRPLLRVRQGVNPEAPALFARASLDAAEAGLAGAPRDAAASREGAVSADLLRARAARCLDGLLATDSSRVRRPDGQSYRGACWGYHHAWQNTGFYQPPGYPNCYLTTIVAGALLHGYRALGKPAWLEAARRAADFLLLDLPVFSDDGNEKCIAYVPDMQRSLKVVNINALAAALLAELAAVTGEKQLADEARKLMTFVVRKQTAEGAWYYTTDPAQSLVAHDNYHTGMILDALLTFGRALGEDGFAEPFSRGLRFYRERLFEPDGAPRWSSDTSLPHDAHGSGQGTLTFALAGDIETASRIASWGITAFYKKAGEFSYQRTRFMHKRMSLLHWSSGWMVRGLAALALASHAR